MIAFKWALLPIIGGVLSISTITTTYLYLVLVDDVPLFLPYISLATEYHVASNLFACGMALYAALTAATMLVKHVQFTTEARRNRSGRCTRRLVRAALVVGLIALLGLLVLATFDIGHKDTVQIHNSAAGVAFLCMLAYGVLVLVISRRLNLRDWFWRRVALIATAIVALISLLPLFVLYPYGTKRSFAGAICEYVMCLSMMIFSSTFAVEFARFRIDVTLVDSGRHNDRRQLLGSVADD